MKEIRLCVDGKDYAKTQLMVGDWLRSLEFTEKYADKNVLLDSEAGLAAMKLLAEYLDAPFEKIKEECTLPDIMRAWRDFNFNIVEAFTGVEPGKNIPGPQGPDKQ